MKALLFAIAVLTLAPACKKTAQPATPATSRVDGVLAYRASCQDQPVLPFPGQTLAGGPVLYLTDMQNQVRGGYVKPDYYGRFSMESVKPGEYRLRLAAGSLRSFWAGAPVTGLRVVVPATPARVTLGVVCADSMPPTALQVAAQWNESDVSRGAPGDMLHLEDAAGRAQLSVSAEVDGVRRELTGAWNLTDAAAPVTLAGAALSWAPGTVTYSSVTGLAGDGLGSFVPVTVPFRLHARRAEGKRVGGWLDFADPATLAVFSRQAAAGATLETLAHGARLSAPAGPEFAEASLTSEASYLAATIAVAAVLDLERLDAGTELSLTLHGPFFPQVVATLRMTATGGVLAIVDGQGGVAAEAPWQPTPTAVMQLTYEPASGAASVAIGEFAPTQLIGGVLAATTRPTDRLAPVFSVRRGLPEWGGAFDVTCAGLQVSETTMLYRLPITPQALNGRTYDGTPQAPEPHALAFVESRGYIGDGEMWVSMTQPAPLSTYLIQYNGAPTTLITDLTPASVAREAAIDAYDRETFAPINAGGAMLY